MVLASATLLWLIGTLGGEGPYPRRDADAFLIKQSAAPADAGEERSRGYGRGPQGRAITANGCFGASGPRVPAPTATA